MIYSTLLFIYTSTEVNKKNISSECNIMFLCFSAFISPLSLSKKLQYDLQCLLFSIYLPNDIYPFSGIKSIRMYSTVHQKSKTLAVV